MEGNFEQESDDKSDENYEKLNDKDISVTNYYQVNSKNDQLKGDEEPINDEQIINNDEHHLYNFDQRNNRAEESLSKAYPPNCDDEQISQIKQGN